MLIKKIRYSLTVRIFLITSLIIIASCGITYGVIALATPITYTNLATDELREGTDKLLSQLAGVKITDAEPLVEQFIKNTGADVFVTDKDGNSLDIGNISISLSTVLAEDSGTAVQKGTGNGTIKTDKENIGVYKGWTGEVIKSGNESTSSAVISTTSSLGEYPFSFLDSTEIYTLVVIGNGKAVNQTMAALGKVVPFLAVIVIAIAVLSAVFYSRYITRPIVQISTISQKMSALDFGWKCEDTREDEIGVLGRSLNELSDRLCTALTELKEANAALRQDIDREKEMERQRLAFFSAASHELKTPLTIIKGQLSGMLSQIDIYRDRDKYLARSLGVANRMESMVQEILTVTRMESGDFVLHIDDVDLSDLAQRQIKLVGDLLEQKNLQVQASLLPNTTIHGDALLLQKVLDNLISNAIFYSPPGQTISIWTERRKNDLLFHIENSGVQIPEEDIPHLFEAFYRVEQSRNRRTGGSGLGLYIVRMILDRHYARYKIENTGRGVGFTIWFSTQ